MKHIIPPISKNELKKELNEERFLRFTNFGKNEIYVVNHLNSPNTMLEIGRLRELTFRNAGGGTGKEADIDALDMADEPYQQLLIWDPEAEEILGGYRFILGYNVNRKPDGTVNMATANLFELSEQFISEYLPHTIELGRSFVQPNYQSRGINRKTLFALDNLWDGLGALIVDNPEMKYFFGKVTMYTDYNLKARDTILYFLKRKFGDTQRLLYPKEPLEIQTPEEELKILFLGKNYDESYKTLSRTVRELGENIPPLINSYMNLSPTMVTFGTSVNKGFGNVEETAILITVDDIYPEKKARHIDTYKKTI
ncbi:MAG: GNAT family N-acetyltransferase [Bacteroidales bacterium]|nr:GNAT family N-acetyltransferase [Bacteroidales bacterium]